MSWEILMTSMLMMAAAPLISKSEAKKRAEKNKTDHSLQGKGNSPAIPLF